MAKVYAQGGNGLSSPVVDTEGVLHAVSPVTGVVLRDESGHLEPILNTGSVPNSVAFDGENAMYMCDFGHQALLLKTNRDELPEVFVKEYEGRAFRGPNSAVFDSKGALYFTDSGPIGETTIAHPDGSVFMVTQGEILIPLAHGCLAHPAGLALSPDENVLYVAETMNNRILRFVQQPKGVYHFSVFHQFSGLLGPVGMACDKAGRVIVTRFDYRGNSDEGVVSVLGADGKLEKEIPIPGGPEVTGVALHGGDAYVTEASSNTIYVIKKI